jgi:hypothetical protein
VGKFLNALKILPPDLQDEINQAINPGVSEYDDNLNSLLATDPPAETPLNRAARRRELREVGQETYDPLPLPGELKAMELPLEAFPECFQAYITEAAASIVCPFDFIAIPLLVTAGTVIGRARRIELKSDWHEYPALYAGIVGVPGDKKSPAISKGTKPINRLSKKLYEDHGIERENYETALVDYELKTAKWKKSALTKNGTNEKRPEKPVEPPCPRLYAVDATIESIAEILQANPRGIAIIRDELSAWVKSMNQYKKGKGADREFWLSCWAGAPAHVDRKGSEPIILFSPFLSVCGCIPPDILPELTDEKNRADGFMDRVLFAFPEQIGQAWSDAVISEEAIQSINKCFDELMKLDFDRDGEPVNISLNIKARDRFINWINGHYEEMERENFPYILRGPWAKMPGQLARITLIIHLCRHAASETENVLIDDASMANGILLTEYFKNHACKVYNALELTRQDRKIMQFAEWIKKGNKTAIKPRDLQRHGVAGCKTATDAKNLLKAVTEYGYGFWDENKKIFNITISTRQPDKIS